MSIDSFSEVQGVQEGDVGVRAAMFQESELEDFDPDDGPVHQSWIKSINHNPNGYAFIEGTDFPSELNWERGGAGKDIYFDENTVGTDTYSNMKQGDFVRYQLYTFPNGNVKAIRIQKVLLAPTNYTQQMAMTYPEGRSQIAKELNPNAEEFVPKKKHQPKFSVAVAKPFDTKFSDTCDFVSRFEDFANTDMEAKHEGQSSSFSISRFEFTLYCNILFIL